MTVVNGVARLEFHRLEVVERGGNRELRPVGEFTVALPVPGFVHALGVLENVRERFIAQGLITLYEPGRLVTELTGWIGDRSELSAGGGPADAVERDLSDGRTDAVYRSGFGGRG